MVCCNRLRNGLQEVPVAVTYSDIARHAGVSTATVSRVLSGSDPVSDAIAARVRASADALGYRSNRAARALRKNTSETIALVFPDIEQPFFATIARVVEDHAARLGRPTIVCNTGEDLEREQVLLDLIIDERVAGLILAPSDENFAAAAAVVEAGIPLITVDRRFHGDPVSSVLVDNQAGARALVADLLDHGHRRIAAITGTAAATSSRERLAGCQQAVAAVPGASLLIAEGKMRDAIGIAATTEMAGRLLSEMLAGQDDPPTAIFCGNGIITQGVVRALKSAGRAIPGEVAVAGFDDLPMFDLLEPPLTVAAQPVEEIGRIAGRLLFQAIENPGREPRVVTVPPQLRFRLSCGGHPAAATGRGYMHSTMNPD
jgi:DNA-binding LacI/PurR family transcriptional regulator